MAESVEIQDWNRHEKNIGSGLEQAQKNIGSGLGQMSKIQVQDWDRCRKYRFMIGTVAKHRISIWTSKKMFGIDRCLVYTG